MAYGAVFFDLFDTLVRFERDRLPEIQISGRRVRSTAGHLHAVLARAAPQVTLEECYAALQASWQEAERLRAIDHREVPARERFAVFFQRLGLDGATLPPDLDVALIDAHRRELAKAASFPAHHRPLLERLARRQVRQQCVAAVRIELGEHVIQQQDRRRTGVRGDEHVRREPERKGQRSLFSLRRVRSAR